MRNNKPLRWDKTATFKMSHFECFAEWVEYNDVEHIEVRVYFDGSGDAIMSHLFPTTLTLGEIKSGMAVFILKELQKMQTKVLNFWERYVR